MLPLGITVVLLAAAIFIAFGVLVEMYNQLAQVRKYLELVDTPTSLDLGKNVGETASSVGLPVELDSAGRAVLLFLSNKCETCLTIAESLVGAELPSGLWVALVPVMSGDMTDFLNRYPLRGQRILLDGVSDIASRLGLDVTPSAVIIEDGRMRSAQTIPTIRQLSVALHPKKTPVPSSRPAESREISLVASSPEYTVKEVS